VTSPSTPGGREHFDTVRPGPLHGVRVLDLTSVVMGPLATQILGDLGADVLTVEAARGDINRGMGPGPHRQLSDISLNLLRNKRNIALDLKHPDGKDALLRIAATCDALVTNLRPAPLARLSLDYHAVAAVRPDIVYCQAHGFSSDSPHANVPAFDDIIQAAAGVPDVTRRAGDDPSLLPTLIADKVCGLVLAYSLIAALYHRARTGEGQRIELPMIDALRAFMLVEHASGGITPGEQTHTGYQRILTPHRRAQQTRDGWIAVFPYLDAHWKVLLRAGDSAQLLDDPRLSRQGRQTHPGFAYQTLARVLTTRTTAEWLTLCANHDIPATEAADLDTLVRDLPDTEHPVVGPHKLIPPPARFHATPASVRQPAPLIGQHNHEILAEAGFNPSEITQLENLGVLRGPRSDRIRATDASPPSDP
jgi:crotonobetainyl-CoA:carnitine CoA-transferase CaiB-like acyl-CoA transferase